MSDDLVQRLRGYASAWGGRPNAQVRIDLLDAADRLAIRPDTNPTSVFEYMRDADGTVTACRTVTTTSWRPL